MTGGNENKKSGEEQQQDTGDIRGRIHNSQNPDLEQHGVSNDISSVDQQEGNMNHGESGGNLDQPMKEA